MTKHKIANYKILENYTELKQYYPDIAETLKRKYNTNNPWAIVVINNLKQVKNTILLITQIFQNNYIMIRTTYIVLKTVL